MENLDILEQNLQYRFKDRAPLEEALSHSSYAHENDLPRSNERMEFLGDAVLHFVLTEFLMDRYSDNSEGELSSLRSYCESEPFLYEHAMQLDLGSFIRFGKGELLSGGAAKESVLADALEAVIAAIHMDGGYDAARDFVLRLLKGSIIGAYDSALHMDSKSELQKITQKEFKTLPEYTVVEESGLDHEKTFSVQVKVSASPRVYIATGSGRNKKAAEKDAARLVLEQLKSNVS